MDESTRTPESVITVRGTSDKADAPWEELLARAAQGDSLAFARLYDESSSLVYALVLRILRNEADAEEVTLDVYTQIWRNSGGYRRDRGSARAWMTTLARSRAIDRVRSGAWSGNSESLDSVAELQAVGLSPEQSSSAVEQRRRVLTALDKLSPEQKQAIVLAYYSGFSQSELAVKLGEPLGTVKTRIRLGLIKLRTHFEGQAR